MANLKQKKQATTSNYKMTAPAQKPNESNYAYAQRLAKMADTRLRRLEKLAESDESYKNATKWAYAGAMHDIESLYGGGKTFQRRAKKTKAGKYNEKQIQAQITAIKRFIESPTSTKSGITKTFKKRADTLNKKFGTNFTWEDLGKFFQSGLADKMDLKYGSKTKMQAIGLIQQNDFKTINDIKKYRSSTTLTNDEEIALDQAEALMRQYKKDINTVL